jgi:hypothetical protein
MERTAARIAQIDSESSGVLYGLEVIGAPEYATIVARGRPEITPLRIAVKLVEILISLSFHLDD